MSNLRVGLIGLGMMGRNHARVLMEIEGVDLIAIADPTGDRFRIAAGCPVVATAGELITHGLDYCVVAAPTGQHEQIAAELADAGINALIEKPLSHDAASAARIAESFEKKGLLGAVGHIERYNAALQQARKRVANGELGEIYQVATRRLGPFPGRIADVGVVKDLGTHDIDLTAWVTQQWYSTVAAQTANRSGRAYEDLVSIVGRLSGGTVANHLVNWLSPLKERTTIITGEKGALVADTLSADLTFYANGNVETTWSGVSQFRGVSEGDMIRFAFAKPEPLRVEHEAFRDAILGKQDANVVTLREGLKTVQVADAILESARSNTSVTLP